LCLGVLKKCLSSLHLLLLLILDGEESIIYKKIWLRRCRFVRLKRLVCFPFPYFIPDNIPRGTERRFIGAEATTSPTWKPCAESSLMPTCSCTNCIPFQRCDCFCSASASSRVCFLHTSAQVRGQKRREHCRRIRGWSARGKKLQSIYRKLE
jgi:hypothetical protein